MNRWNETCRAITKRALRSDIFYYRGLFSGDYAAPHTRRRRESSPHFCWWNNARPLRDDYASAQKHKIRNRLDPKLSGEGLAFLRIDLED
jgi:hypothetical protein